MLNIWGVKKVAIVIVVMLSTASPVVTERQQEVDFSPFGSEDVNQPPKSQFVIDQSPIITQFEMEGGSISESFQIISDKTGWSILPTEEVSRARVSLFVKDISAQQLLDTIVKLAGFIYHRQDNVVTVMTYDEYAEYYGLEKKVVLLEHANADSVATVVKTFLSKPGKMVVHPQTNTIVLLESRANLDTILPVIEDLDVPTEPETTITVIDLQYMDAEVLAETLQRIFANEEPKDIPTALREGKSSNPSSERITAPKIVKEQPLSTPRSMVGIYAIGRTNQLIVKAIQSDMEQLKSLVKILDVYVEPTTQSYHFTYVDASEVYNGLEEILDLPTRANRYGRSTGQGAQQGGRPGGLTLVTRTNSILLTAPPSVHRVMASIAKSVDVPGMYEAGMIRVYKLENADVDEVASAIKELIEGRDRKEKETGEPKYKTTPREGAPPAPETTTPLSETEEFVPQIEARVTVSKSTNSVIIQATEREHRELEKLIKELDKRQKQVLIKAVIIEVTTSDDLDVGVEIDHFQGDPIAFTSYGLSSIDPATGMRDIIVSPGGTTAVLNPDKVQAIFKALQGKDNVRIESAPQILVNNNAVGAIMSIAEEPTRQTNQGETTTTTSFGEYVTAGTQFYITPHISESDYLLVDYQIMLNSFGEKADPELPPARNTSTIQGRATVPSGSTIIVGGIQASSASESIDKVPILGDVPLVGLVFRNTIIRKQRITTYLFISTTIMESENFDDLKHVSDKVIDKVKKDGSGKTLGEEVEQID